MPQRRNEFEPKTPRLVLGPKTTGQIVLLYMLDLVNRDKARREKQLQTKVQAELANILEMLKKLAYEASPNHSQAIEQILKFLGPEKILKSALTAGTIGINRVNELFAQAESFVDDAIEAWPDTKSNEKVRSDLATLKIYLRKACSDIIFGLEEARAMRVRIQQNRKRIAAILKAVSHPLYKGDLFERIINSQSELDKWVTDIKEFFLTEKSSEIVEVKDAYRGAYINAWDGFITVHFPQISHELVGTKNSYSSGYEIELKIEEILNKQLIQSTLASFKEWASTKKVQESTKKFVQSERKFSSSADSIEFKRVDGLIELWIEIPLSFKGALVDLRREVVINLGSLKQVSDVIVRLGRRKGQPGDFLVVATPSTTNSKWIKTLEQFVEQQIQRLLK